MMVQNDAEMKGFVMHQKDTESEKFWKWKNLEIFLSVDGHVPIPKNVYKEKKDTPQGKWWCKMMLRWRALQCTKRISNQKSFENGKISKFF